MKIVDIPIDQIQPEEMNPNVLDDAELDALREEIRLRGFLQPVLVRPIPATSANPKLVWKLIDGEHRWRLLGELGAETVPAVVEEDKDEYEALIRTITMNRFRGAPIPLRLAHVLADLSDRIPETELRDRLALGADELRDLLDLAGYLAPEPEATSTSPTEREDVERTLSVRVTVVAPPKQAERIHSLLDDLTGGDAEKEGAVIARKAREFDQR